MEKLPPEPPSSEITPFDTYVRRREFIQRTALFVTTSVVWGGALTLLSQRGTGDKPKPPPVVGDRAAWRAVSRETYGLTDPENSFEDITTYNNYYELGLDKCDARATRAHVRTRPGRSGRAARSRSELGSTSTRCCWFGLRRARLSDALRRSLVDGDPMDRLSARATLKRVEPTSRAKYVAFTTLHRSEAMPGQAEPRLALAVRGRACASTRRCNPLALLAVGLYGAPLPGQNGAPHAAGGAVEVRLQGRSSRS